LPVRRTNLKTLHKYLIRQVLATLFLTVAVFTFVLLIGDALKEILPMLISGRARLGTILEVTGYLIPFIWVFALPMGFLTATLLVFGRFSADQELTAARASGISLLSLVSPVLLLSIFFCGISAWINLDIGPRSRVAFVNLRHKLLAELVDVALPEGRYISDFPGYIFYTEKNDKGKLENVMIYMLENETNVSTTIRAPRGEIEVDATNKQFTVILFDARMLTRKNDGKFVPTSVVKLPFAFDLNASTNQIYKPKISDMTFGQLQDELRDLEKNLSLPPAATTNSAELRAQLAEAGRQRNDLTEPVRVEMNRQVAFSFACFGFALIGIPLGIRVHRRETNIGVAIALVLVLVYYSFMLVGESLSAHPEWSPHLIFWLPNFIFQAVGAVLLWRANRGI
jgi:lipopolysaccharide export system permease protein